METHEETSGERAVKGELRHLKIRFNREKKIYNLRDDRKPFRKADFYLPDYDVYIEFLGRWSTSEEDREEYREKMRVYEYNNINCIYIFPEQLYKLKYVIQEELKKFGIDIENSGTPPGPYYGDGYPYKNVIIFFVILFGLFYFLLTHGNMPGGSIIAFYVAFFLTGLYAAGEYKQRRHRKYDKKTMMTRTESGTGRKVIKVLSSILRDFLRGFFSLGRKQNRRY